MWKAIQQSWKDSILESPKLTIDYCFYALQVSAPDHFGYCNLTPSEEVSEGFYNFSAAQLKAFSERFKGQESIDGYYLHIFIRS